MSIAHAAIAVDINSRGKQTATADDVLCGAMLFFLPASLKTSAHSAVFVLPPQTEKSRAELRREVAGATRRNPFILNGQLVGTTDWRDNHAWSRTKCGPLDITGALRPGENTLVIRTVEYPEDQETPLDDIEIYDLRIILIHDPAPAPPVS
jgi:hypothetical protein